MGLPCSEAIKPSRKAVVITQPNKPSEFEIQSDLYSRLKALGLDVRGEVPAKLDGKKSIFDLVVFNGQQAVVIIEVKNSPNLALLYGKKTRQSVKYKAYGLPVVFCTTATPIETVVETVLKHTSVFTHLPGFTAQ